MHRIDLKAFRRANKISQLDLADFFGVGQSFISQVEKGDRPLPKDYISKLLAHSSWDTSTIKVVAPGLTQGIATPRVKVVGDVARREAESERAYELLVKDYKRQIADKDATIQELCKKIGMLEAKIELLGKGDITPESV